MISQRHRRRRYCLHNPFASIFHHYLSHNSTESHSPRPISVAQSLHCFDLLNVIQRLVYTTSLNFGFGSMRHVGFSGKIQISPIPSSRTRIPFKRNLEVAWMEIFRKGGE